MSAQNVEILKLKYQLSAAQNGEAHVDTMRAKLAWLEAEAEAKAAPAAPAARHHRSASRAPRPDTRSQSRARGHPRGDAHGAARGHPRGAPRRPAGSPASGPSSDGKLPTLTTGKDGGVFVGGKPAKGVLEQYFVSLLKGEFHTPSLPLSGKNGMRYMLVTRKTARGVSRGILGDDGKTLTLGGVNVSLESVQAQLKTGEIRSILKVRPGKPAITIKLPQLEIPPYQPGKEDSSSEASTESEAAMTEEELAAAEAFEAEVDALTAVAIGDA